METDLISIIVPVYKVESYLDACISSIVNQTYRNLEIILVDDGSPDNCPQMCDIWAKKDSRIRVIHQENGGAAAARNAGLDLARGNYIGFVDSDDMIRPDMYELLMKALLVSSKKIACCCDGWQPGLPYKTDGIQMCEMGVEDTLNGIFRGVVGTSVWRRLYYKSVWEELRFPEGEINEDYPVLIPATVAAGGMVQVLAPLYYYRPAPGSVTNTYWRKDCGIVLKNLDRMKMQLAQHSLNCMPCFREFYVRSVYTVAIIMEKHKKDFDISCKETYQCYLQIMRMELIYMLRGNFLKWKDKFLYMMIVTHTLRPIYQIMGRL